ncbi:MAG: ABC transporter permease [Candidatus Aminicenantes bacterium]|nr:ABC transporter permease [Candidatus Aminicenantes bacterium]
MILGLNFSEIIEIIRLTIFVSCLSTLLAFFLAIPAAFFLYFHHFPGRKLLISLINTAMGLPPVVVGLLVALLFWRSGPLGSLRLMYTPAAIITAQIFLAWPIITGLTLASLYQVDPDLLLQARALGASRKQLYLVLWKEARLGEISAIMAAFGAVISEVGAVLMVGGNIKGHTRVLTTAILQETRLGNFSLAIFLALILLAISLTINWFLTSWQQKVIRPWRYQSWK